MATTNAALEVAAGEWLMFVNADDTVPERCVNGDDYRIDVVDQLAVALVPILLLGSVLVLAVAECSERYSYLFPLLYPPFAGAVVCKGNRAA